MTVQMHSIKDAIMYVLQKAHYKDARERQQQVIVAYCWLSLFLGDLSVIVQKKLTECTSKMMSLCNNMMNLQCQM